MLNDDQRFLELLDRWVRGDFTRSDERVLRTLIESDEFRREAWEGLTALPEADHAGRLAALRARLPQGRKPGRVVPLGRWMAAAAAVALLAVAVLFFRNWNRIVETPVASTPSENAAPTPGDDLSDATPPAPANQPERSASAPAGSASPTERQDAADRAAPEKESVSPAIEADEAVTLAESAPEMPRDRMAGEEKMADDKAAAKPSQTVTAAPAPPASGAPARSQSAGKAKARPGQPAPDSARWFNTDTRPDVEAMKKDARQEDQTVAPEPAGGWDAFTEFLRQNARLTPEARNNNVSGTVRLRFQVNENGEPYNFQVVKPLGYGCDQEAIRLVKEWDWSPGAEPVLVEIRFVR